MAPRRPRALPLAGLALALLAGCATQIDPSLLEVPLEVPLGSVTEDYGLELDEKMRGYDLYPIPAGTVIGAPMRPRALPRAREIIRAGLSRQLSIRRVRHEYWLAIELPPSSVWPALKSYVISRRSGLQGEDPREGVLISNWVTREGGRYRFAYRLDGGMVPGSAEIQLRVFASDGGAERVLSPREADPLISAELRELLSYLVEAPASTGSLVVQHLDFRSRVAIDLANNLPEVRMELSRDRAWLLVREAIERSDLKLLQADQRQLVWEVEFIYDREARLPSMRHLDDSSWDSTPASDLVRLRPAQGTAGAAREDDLGAAVHTLRLVEEEADIRLQLDSTASFRVRRALLSSLVRNLR